MKKNRIEINVFGNARCPYAASRLGMTRDSHRVQGMTRVRHAQPAKRAYGHLFCRWLGIMAVLTIFIYGCGAEDFPNSKSSKRTLSEEYRVKASKEQLAAVRTNLGEFKGVNTNIKEFEKSGFKSAYGLIMDSASGIKALVINFSAVETFEEEMCGKLDCVRCSGDQCKGRDRIAMIAATVLDKNLNDDCLPAKDSLIEEDFSVVLAPKDLSGQGTIAISKMPQKPGDEIEMSVDFYFNGGSRFFRADSVKTKVCGPVPSCKAGYVLRKKI